MKTSFTQTKDVVGSEVDTSGLTLNIYTTVLYAFLVIAAFFIIVAFFGCCGAWKVSTETRVTHKFYDFPFP